MKMDQIHQNCIKSNENHFENSQLRGVDDLEDTFTEFSPTGEPFEFTGPVIANFTKDGRRVNYSAGPCHVLITGGTGSGKTENFYLAQGEAIPRSTNRPSVVFMDLKGTFYRRLSSLYKKRGYKIGVLNLKDPFFSSRYNPLAPAWHSYQSSVEAKNLLQGANGTERSFHGKKYKTFLEWKAAVQCHQMEQLEFCQNHLRRLAALIVSIESQKEPSWEAGAQSMLYLILYGMLEDKNMTLEMYTIANALRIADCTEDDCGYIHRWIQERDPTSIVWGLLHYYNRNARTTREGFISTLGAKTDVWKNISTEWVTSGTDIDIEEIARNVNEQPYAIFLIVDETKPENYNLCMAFIDHLISALKIRNDKVGPIERDFIILADEFANMPAMPNIQNRISTLRSYRVWLYMGIQSYDQLDDRYGEKVRKIIEDNCDVSVFFGTNNAKTVKAFAESLGQKAASITSYNISNEGKLSISISAMDRPLVRESDLSTMQLGEAYVRIFRKASVFTQLEPHFRCKDLWHDNTEPPKVIADLSQLEKLHYDIRTICSNSRPHRRFDFDF